MSLRLAPGLALPIDVAGEAVGILATRGAGKSFTSAVLTEELLGQGIQVVVVDPTGVYWGLRSSADGNRKGLGIYVLGGLHGDLPLEPAAGGVRERPTGHALLEQWLRHPRVGEGERRVLTALIDQYPEAPSHDELCDLTGYSPSASMIGVILSKLRKLGLVEKGARRAAAEFMEAIQE